MGLGRTDNGPGSGTQWGWGMLIMGPGLGHTDSDNGPGSGTQWSVGLGHTESLIVSDNGQMSAQTQWGWGIPIMGL